MMRIPAPPKRNPFKAGSLLARQFDGCLKARKDGHKDMRPGAGNGLASAFWRGFNGIPPLTAPEGSLAYAAYRAGQYHKEKGGT